MKFFSNLFSKNYVSPDEARKQIEGLREQIKIQGILSLPSVKAGKNGSLSINPETFSFSGNLEGASFVMSQDCSFMILKAKPGYSYLLSSIKVLTSTAGTSQWLLELRLDKRIYTSLSVYYAHESLRGEIDLEKYCTLSVPTNENFFEHMHLTHKGLSEGDTFDLKILFDIFVRRPLPKLT